MPDALSYATPQCSPGGIRLEEAGDGAVRLTIPPPALWPVAVGLSFGLILAALGCLLGAALSGVWVHAGRVSWGGGLTGVIAAASFGGVALHLLWRVWRLPRTGMVPTVVEADAQGLSISTARRGQLERLHYPTVRILAIGVYPGPMTVTLRRTMRIAMRVRPEGSLTGRETVVFEFEADRSARSEQLGAALQCALRLESATADEFRRLRQQMILHRI